MDSINVHTNYKLYIISISASKIRYYLLIFFLVTQSIIWSIWPDIVIINGSLWGFTVEYFKYYRFNILYTGHLCWKWHKFYVLNYTQIKWSEQLHYIRPKLKIFLILLYILTSFIGFCWLIFNYIHIYINSTMSRIFQSIDWYTFISFFTITSVARRILSTSVLISYLFIRKK